MTSASDLRKLFEDYLKEHPVGTFPESLYDPAQYIMSRGGKRMRPVLLLLSHRMWSNDPTEALPAALAVEVFHNFTLVHDDIMDAAAVRRGDATVHEKFGQNAAILSGDVMLIRSFDLLIRSCHPGNVLEIMESMTAASIRICEGQQLDLDYEQLEEVSEADYIHMNNLKTAVLLGSAMKIGALLADAPLEQANKLYAAGELLGKAFQIQDDILDAYGDASLTGKKRGGDILHAKKTILYTALISRLGDNRRQTFIDLYKEHASNPEVKIQQVLRWLDEHGIREHAERLCDNLYRDGLKEIEAVEGSAVGKALLIDYIGQLLNRNQ